MLLKLSFIFCAGSFIGWVLELFFRRFCTENRREKKWINPGFLVGPYLPLYGFGICVLYILSRLSLLPLFDGILGGVMLVIIMMLALTLLEYVTGMIFIKGMKINLWDYSDECFNINGIICLRFSLFWGILSAFYLLAVDPFVNIALDWLAAHLSFCFFIGFYMGIFTIDLIYSFNVLAKVRKFAAEHNIVVQYEKLRTNIGNALRAHKKKRRFFLTLQSDTPISEHLSAYLKQLERNVSKEKSKISDKLSAKKSKFKESESNDGDHK